MRSSESVHGVGSGSLDARITERVFSRFCSLESIPRDAVSRRSLARLRGAVERAELVLSTIADAKTEVEAFHEGIDLYSFPIPRASLLLRSAAKTLLRCALSSPVRWTLLASPTSRKERSRLLRLCVCCTCGEGLVSRQATLAFPRQRIFHRHRSHPHCTGCYRKIDS